MTETTPDAENNPAGTKLAWDDPSTLPVEEVKALFVVLAKALRAHQLYDENNPVYQRFRSQLSEAFQGLWADMDRLPISVEENRFLWMGESVYASDSRERLPSGLSDFTEPEDEHTPILSRAMRNALVKIIGE